MLLEKADPLHSCLLNFRARRPFNAPRHRTIFNLTNTATSSAIAIDVRSERSSALTQIETRAENPRN